MDLKFVACKTTSAAIPVRPQNAGQKETSDAHLEWCVLLSLHDLLLQRLEVQQLLLDRGLPARVIVSVVPKCY